MSMIYLANVKTYEDKKGINFHTPHEHVAVDFPQGGTPYYVVWAYFNKTDIMATKDFATAMDTAARWLKQAEPA